MKGRKRAAFVLLAVLLALLFALPGGAEDTVFFTVINNTLLELDADTMPVIYSSLIYVPSSLFNSRALDTYAYYSRDTQVALISDGDSILYFDMGAGNSYDSEDNTYRYAAIYVNDTAYVPAYFVADYFGLGYSYIRREGRHIVRLTNGSAMTDDEFFSAASLLMEQRMNQYLGTTETPSPVPTAAPATPRPTPVAPPSPTPTPAVDRSGVKVHLCYLGLGEGTAAILDALDGESACFFCTAEQLYAFPDLARRITGSGSALGLLLLEDPETEYPAFLKAMGDTVMSASFLAAGISPDGELGDRARAAGLCYTGGDSVLTDYGGCRRKLESASGSCDLLLDAAFADTGRLLELLLRDRYGLEAGTEVTIGR